MAATTLEELQIKFTAQMGGLTSQLNGVKKQLGGVETSVKRTSTAFAGLARAAKLFIGAYVIRGMIKFGKESLSMANEVVESEQLFTESMKGMSQAARDWSDGLQKDLGLNAYTLRKNVGTMNVMLKSMGMSTQKAYEMSTGLTELAEDMASFYNMDPAEMFGKLQSGMTGMGMPLKQIGILVDEHIIKEYALREGIIETSRELTHQEKVMARYAAIMAQTSAAQGDLARTINSPVNQIRVLNNQLDMVKITLGQAFQPIQAIVIPILNSLARAALTATNAIKNFMWALTGFTGISSGAADVAGKGADANGKLADSLNDTSKALKNAGGAAKKAAKDAKVGLKAFDEINKLADESEKAIGGSGGLGEMPEVIKNEAYADALESVNVAMSKAADWLKKVWEVAEPTRAALSRLWDTIKDYANTVIWGNLVDFYEKFLKPVGLWTITDALPAFLDAVSAAIVTLKTVWEESRPAWERFYQTVLKPMGEWVGDRIINALRWLKQAFDDISAWIKENPAAFSAISEGILAIVTAFLVLKGVVGTITLIQNGFKALAGVLAFFTSPTGIIALVIAGLILLATHWDEVKKFAIDAWEKIEGAWSVAAAWFDENVAQPIVKFFSDAWGKVLIFARITWDNIKSAWNTAATWLDESVAQPIVKFFSDAWGKVLIFARTTWTLIQGAWQSASQWMYEKVTQPVAQFFTNLWTGITTAASNAQEAIQQAWSGLAGWFETNIIAPIRKAWDDLMNFLGIKKTVEVEYKVTTYQNTVYTSTGGNEYGSRGGSIEPAKSTGRVGSLGEVLLPFAKGGVFPPNKPFVGLLGDQKHGRNIEAPENLIRQIFRDEMFGNPAVSLASMPTSSFGGMGSGISGIENGIERGIARVMDRLNINLNVDGQTFGTASIRAINDVQRDAGRLLLEM